MNEPKLRFKADDGSNFPDWEEKKLGDITEKVVRKNENSNADVRMISQGNGFILQSDKYSRENAGQSLKKYTLLKRDEFAYNHGASKVKPYGVCYRLCESDEARVPYVYHTFRLIDDDSDFWNYSLNTSYMDRQLKKMVSSGARMDGLLNISYDAYMSVNIHVPSIPEQQKIAEFLSTVDTVIEKQKETVSAWEERKKGVMQKLFSQEVRFKADDGSDFPEWEEKKLGDVADVKVGEKPTLVSDNAAYEYVNAGTTNSGYVDSYNCDGDTVTTPSRGQGGIGYVGYQKHEFWLGPLCYKIKSNKDDVLTKFMYYALSFDSKKIVDLKKVGTIPAINRADLIELYMNFPCLEEQQKIADCLSSLDEVIEKQKATLAAWEELKKGLLQQMFV